MILTRRVLQPEAMVQSLAWRRDHQGGCSCGHISAAEEILCPSPKTVLLGAEPGSISLGQGFHLPQCPWEEKTLTQEPRGTKGLTSGQDLAPKPPSLLLLVGLHTPPSLPQKLLLLQAGRCFVSLWAVAATQYCCKQPDLALEEKRGGAGCHQHPLPFQHCPISC